ncbi:hypothetical protein CC1G_08007 [Coprinopsis cinerea okayama7|uniref:Uncharacterized protein n=1 Tax=Coprinopsis cinerea (strain Okayama-7 / 130 / ATCC MYA-4618 / FGSC 9003) TaxID=240176 RepID=A8NQ86_COPC7|nr:hypothetical protein CC1G_08007 [Coprinopsis cinerea okayama7\|eukprot:XP_001835498.2 hypothetical protein CC1G_08007 [Coprinopsis cinerea okayama7\
MEICQGDRTTQSRTRAVDIYNAQSDRHLWIGKKVSPYNEMCAPRQGMVHLSGIQNLHVRYYARAPMRHERDEAESKSLTQPTHPLPAHPPPLSQPKFTATPTGCTTSSTIHNPKQALPLPSASSNPSSKTSEQHQQHLRISTKPPDLGIRYTATGESTRERERGYDSCSPGPGQRVTGCREAQVLVSMQVAVGRRSAGFDDLEAGAKR